MVISVKKSNNAFVKRKMLPNDKHVNCKGDFETATLCPIFCASVPINKVFHFILEQRLLKFSPLD